MTRTDFYRRLVGRLIYLTILYPDLAYYVQVLSLYMHQLRRAHWDTTFHACFKRTPGQGLLLLTNSELKLHAYHDYDLANHSITWRSLTGFFVYFRNFPISWKSKE